MARRRSLELLDVLVLDVRPNLTIGAVDEDSVRGGNRCRLIGNRPIPSSWRTAPCSVPAGALLIFLQLRCLTNQVLHMTMNFGRFRSTHRSVEQPIFRCRSHVDQPPVILAAARRTVRAPSREDQVYSQRDRAR